MVAASYGAGAMRGRAIIEAHPMARILLIEDDDETAEEITAELSDRGFEVEWSANRGLTGSTRHDRCGPTP
jgi:two-component system OmpR family response regulator